MAKDSFKNTINKKIAIRTIPQVANIEAVLIIVITDEIATPIYIITLKNIVPHIIISNNIIKAIIPAITIFVNLFIKIPILKL